MKKITLRLLAIIFVSSLAVWSVSASYVARSCQSIREENGPGVFPLLNRICIYSQLIHRIVVAPKLLYRLEKMEVFTNGVWVDYSITNLSGSNKYVTPRSIGAPVGGMLAWDIKGRRWKIPQFERGVQFTNPDTFILMDPYYSFKRFRSQLSFIVCKPPEPVEKIPGQVIDRPSKFFYFIGNWASVYTELSERPSQSMDIYAIGFGVIPVRWNEINSPRSWRSGMRLYSEDD